MKRRILFPDFLMSYLYPSLLISIIFFMSFPAPALAELNPSSWPQSAGVDSDDDGISDADEILVGTDPDNPDSDSDGIRDGIDPDSIAAVVKRLPPDAFKSKGKGHRTAIVTLLENNQRLILAGKAEKASHMLEQVKRHVDGCPPLADQNDWIVDCEAQGDVQKILDIVLANHVSYTIDTHIEPAVPSLPGLDFGAERPVGVMVDPANNGQPFVLNEVLFRPQDEGALADFLNRYNGTVLRDGTPILLPDSEPPPINFPGSSGWYIIRIDPTYSPLDDLPINMERSGLRGHWLFSSEEAARTASLAAREFASGVSLNYTMELAQQKINEHPDNSGGNLDASRWWWMTEDDDPNVPGDQGLSVGIVHAWEYVRYKGYPPTDTPYSPIKVAVIDAGYDLDETTGDPLFGAGDYPSDFQQIDEIDGDWTAGGMAYGFPNCNGCWHGQMTFGACCALSQNGYGTAGTSGGWGITPLLIKATADVGTVVNGVYDAFYNGADVVHETIGFICGWWCRTFSSENNALHDIVGNVVGADGILVTPANNHGNDISDTYQMPCNFSEAICVGAIEANGTAASYSNWGSIVDTWAPTSFRSTVTRDSAAVDADDVGIDELQVYGGTSAATPYLTGVVALMKMVNPELNYLEVRDILASTSNPSADSKVKEQGYVDAFRAVEAANPNLVPDIAIVSPLSGASEPYSIVSFKAQVTDPETPSLSGISADFSSTMTFDSDRDGFLCSASGDATGGGTTLGCEVPRLSLGSHIITATVTDPFGAVDRDSITINVINSAPVVKITYPADAMTYYSNQQINFRGYAFDDEVFGYIPASWSSDLDGQLGSGNDIWVSLTEGLHTITLTATDEKGLTTTDTISLEVKSTPGGGGYPVVKITQPSSGAVFGKDSEVTFTGQATDPEDGDIITDDSFSWSSDRDSFLGSGRTIQQALSGPVGEGSRVHIITLEVTDSDGNKSTHSIDVTISQIN